MTDNINEVTETETIEKEASEALPQDPERVVIFEEALEAVLFLSFRFRLLR